MASYTYEQLKDMKVDGLRDIAKDLQHEALEGYTTMHKDHLLPALCKALNIDAHAHHVAALAEKTKIKVQIRALKKQRDAAIAAKDYKKVSTVRTEVRRLRRKLRKAAV